jgi:hypothetical protein
VEAGCHLPSERPLSGAVGEAFIALVPRREGVQVKVQAYDRAAQYVTALHVVTEAFRKMRSERDTPCVDARPASTVQISDGVARRRRPPAADGAALQQLGYSW